eukprot:GEZU01017175.1.p1 GENE.GEZU01017175.1~~GEZU01017175.1.p1  ORF type:complete len:792 (-),score=265.30 GEZU01017175.1:118-2493(-)
MRRIGLNLLVKSSNTTIPCRITTRAVTASHLPTISNIRSQTSFDQNRLVSTVSPSTFAHGFRANITTYSNKPTLITIPLRLCSHARILSSHNWINTPTPIRSFATEVQEEQPVHAPKKRGRPRKTTTTTTTEFAMPELTETTTTTTTTEPKKRGRPRKTATMTTTTEAAKPEPTEPATTTTTTTTAPKKRGRPRKTAVASQAPSEQPQTSAQAQVQPEPESQQLLQQLQPQPQQPQPQPQTQTQAQPQPQAQPQQQVLTPQINDERRQASDARIEQGESLEREDSVRALQEYTIALQIDPTNPTGYLKRGELLFNTNQHDEAVSDLLRAVDFIRKEESMVQPLALKAVGLNIDMVQACYILAQIYYEQRQDAKNAVQYLDEIIRRLAISDERYPATVADEDYQEFKVSTLLSAYSIIGLIKNQQGKADEAIEISSNAIDLFKQYLRKTMGLKEDEGVEKFREENFAETVKYAIAALTNRAFSAMNSSLFTIYSNRGTAHALKAQYVEAIGDYTIAVQLSDSREPTALYNRGCAFAALTMVGTESNDAVDDFTAAINLVKEYQKHHLATAGASSPPLYMAELEGSYINRGIEYNKKAMYAEAIQDFKEALKVQQQAAAAAGAENSPASRAAQSETLFNLGYALSNLKVDEETGRPGIERAIEEMTRSLELNPLNLRSLYNRAGLYSIQERYEEAIQDATELIEKLKIEYNSLPDDVSATTSTLPQTTAEIIKKRLLKEADGLVLRGNLYRKLGKKEEAIQDFVAALRIMNESSQYKYDDIEHLQRVIFDLRL